MESTLTPDQIELRRNRITGSEIAAIAGVSPWQTPLDCYLLKTGQIEVKDNFHMERGRHLEAGLRSWYAKRTGHHVVEATTMVHPTIDWIAATPDGLVSRNGDQNAFAVLELKCPTGTTEHWGQDSSDKIPEYYVPQVTWEMACAGLKQAEVAAMIRGDLRIYSLHFDAELFQDLLTIANDFRTKYLLPGVTPPIDASANAIEWLRKRYPVASKDMVASSTELDSLARSLKQIQEQLKELGILEHTLKARIIESLGEHEGAVGEWGKIYYRNQKGRTSTDWKGIAEHLGATPELVEKFTTQGSGSRSLRPYWKGQDE